MDLGYEYLTLKPITRNIRGYHMSLWPGSVRYHVMNTLEIYQLEQSNLNYNTSSELFNDNEIDLRYRLLAAPLTAITSELLTIAESIYAVEHGAQHTSVGRSKSVKAIHISNQK